MKKLFILLAAVAALSAPVMARAAGADGIAAVVNDKPISNAEVADRLKLLMVSSGMQDSPEVREKLSGQVVSMLIDEALRLQEAADQKIAIDEAAIDEGFKSVAAQNNMEAAQFSEILRRSGISEKSLRDQIKAQVAWGMIVEQKLSSQVEVSEFDVDTLAQKLQNNIGKTEYLTAEIFLPVDNTVPENDVRQMADRLARQISEGQARFSAVAMQFSQTAGASKGGDLGWVQEGQLVPELDNALRAIEPGKITPPVRTSMGYHILMMREKRASAPDTMPSREEIFNRLGTQQLDRLQRRHFMNIKAVSFVDRRDNM